VNENQYKEALKTAQNLEYKIKDLIDDKQHSISQSLFSESKRLVDELENKKNPRSLEDQIKGIITLLHHADQEGETVMDHRHADMLHHEYEHFMMSLRKFDNY
jgi:hypothetical protein